MTDKLQTKIIQRAEELGLTAYAVALRAGLNTSTVKRYFSGTQSLSSDKLSKVCDVLGLELRPQNKSAKPTRL